MVAPALPPHESKIPAPSTRLGNFIVDLISLEARLVVGIDGGHHDRDADRLADAQRTLFLEECAFKILRFWNNEVLSNTDGVAARIADFFKGPTPAGRSGPRPLPSYRER
jgi:very-short-patch-repair endonuclease